MLKLHTLRAHSGDCLILEFAKNNSKSKYILIDGGPRNVFKDYLEPYLQKHPGIEFELAVGTHCDDDHIIGLSDLIDKMYSQGFSKYKIAKIKEFWYNSLEEFLNSDDDKKNRMTRALESPKENDPEFDQNIEQRIVEFMELDEPEFVTRSYKSGIELLQKINDMKIPINKGFKKELVSLDSSNLTRKFDEYLTLEIIGPFQEQIDDLLEKWTKWVEKYGHKLRSRDFRGVQKDRSAPNLSSIMFLAEADGKTILFTGDAREDHIINGLRERNILTGETIEVDILKLPHHGSERNVSKEFFETVLAKTYIASGNGDHHNPHANTLKMIAESAKGRGVTIYLTYDSKDIDDTKESGKNRKKRLQEQLEEFEKGCPKKDYDYELKFIDSDKDVFTFVLSE